jgi:hypothetical protein
MTQRNYRQLLLQRAQVELTGASAAGIRQVMYEVFDEFFDVSSAWLEDIPFTTTPNTGTYTITPLATPPGRITRLDSVLDSNSIPQAAMMPDIGTIVLRNTPNTAMTLTAAVIKNVLLPCEPNGFVEVPDVFIQKYFTGLLSGVLGKMMLQPGKSYKNDQGSVYHLKKFEGVKTAARVATIRRNTQGTNSWSYPQTFRTSGQRGGTAVGNDQSFGSPP